MLDPAIFAKLFSSVIEFKLKRLLFCICINSNKMSLAKFFSR